MTEISARPVGVQRDDDLLALADAAVAHRRALVTLAHTVLSFAHVGGTSPVCQDIWTRMRTPVPGDFVVEWTKGMSPRADRDTMVQANGILLGHQREQIGDGESEDVWYVQYGPAPEDVCRWVNAEFFAFPINGERWGWE